MRRVLISVAAAVIGLAVFAAPALATFHLNMVNEAMLASSTGDASVQFVEFLDKGGTEEQFTPVFAPYSLQVYDAAGHLLGSQKLNPTGLRQATAGAKEYLVSTQAADTAFGVTGNERLTVSLPLGAGQVCFAGNEPGPKPVSCMTYGTITHAVATNSFGTGTVHGPVPPNGESDQRLANNTVVAALPTPKAPNHSVGLVIGKPTESGTSLTGVAKRKARLRFSVKAGSNAPALAQLRVALPKGLGFSRRKLASGITMIGPAGGPVRFASSVEHGVLTIALAAPVFGATVTISRGAITVSKNLAANVKRHRVKSLKLALTVVDATGGSTRFTPKVKPR